MPLPETDQSLEDYIEKIPDDIWAECGDDLIKIAAYARSAMKLVLGHRQGKAEVFMDQLAEVAMRSDQLFDRLRRQS
jgi:hypothetical protein